MSDIDHGVCRVVACSECGGSTDECEHFVRRCDDCGGRLCDDCISAAYDSDDDLVGYFCDDCLEENEG